MQVSRNYTEYFFLFRIVAGLWSYEKYSTFQFIYNVINLKSVSINENLNEVLPNKTFNKNTFWKKNTYIKWRALLFQQGNAGVMQNCTTLCNENASTDNSLVIKAEMVRQKKSKTLGQKERKILQQKAVKMFSM